MSENINHGNTELSGTDKKLIKNLIIISGPSGTGKDTIAHALTEKDNSLCISVSATTRPMRANEKEGKDYYFKTEKEFNDLINEDGFIEHACYDGHCYGTLKSDVCRRIDEGKQVILVIEVKGAAAVREKFPGVLSIFILPPDMNTLEKRLRKRATESEESIKKRLAAANDEIMRACEYDYKVVNADLDEAVETVYNIILNRRKEI